MVVVFVPFKDLTSYMLNSSGMDIVFSCLLKLTKELRDCDVTMEHRLAHTLNGSYGVVVTFNNDHEFVHWRLTTSFEPKTQSSGDTK